MNFDFSEDQKLLQKTARDYLAEHCGLDVCRSVLESNGTHSDALWKGVAEMGWLGAAVPEEYGGAGFSRLELALIAQELGRALAPIPFGPSVYLVTEALLEFGSDEQKKKYLPRLVSGELIGTFAQSERAGRSGVADVDHDARRRRAVGHEVSGARRTDRGARARGGEGRRGARCSRWPSSTVRASR